MFKFLNPLLPFYKFSFFEEGGAGGAGGSGGGSAPEWIQTLPDDVAVTVKDQGAEKTVKIKEHPSVGKFKTVGDMAKSYVELEQHKSKLEGDINQRVLVPGKDAKPEDVQAFRTKIGVPQKPEEYKFAELKDLHPDVKPQPEGIKAFAEVSHKLGIPQEQADQLNQWFLKTLSNVMIERDNQTKAANDKAKNELIQSWGKDYDQNMAVAKRFVEGVGGKEVSEALGDLGSNPVLLKFFHKCGKGMSEDGGFNFQNNGGESGSNSAAQKKIDEYRNDPKSAYNDENHPKHADAVIEVRELYKQVHNKK